MKKEGDDFGLYHRTINDALAASSQKQVSAHIYDKPFFLTSSVRRLFKAVWIANTGKQSNPLTEEVDLLQRSPAYKKQKLPLQPSISLYNLHFTIPMP